jgi:hypothetical protein
MTSSIKGSMTTDGKKPLSRPIAVHDLPDRGTDVTVEATADECAALAREFGVEAIQALVGTFHLSGTPRRVHVTGRVEANVTQICVVTLDPFGSDVREEVEVDFATAGAAEAAAAGRDAPDEIVNGTIDLGALTAEFLALGLPPYPRKPGVDFDYKAEDDKPDSPFAALDKLKRGG